jgi:hypothetical protein
LDAACEWPRQVDAVFGNPDYEAGSWEYDRTKLYQYILPDLGHIRVDQLRWQDAQKVLDAMGRPAFTAEVAL